MEVSGGGEKEGCRNGDTDEGEIKEGKGGEEMGEYF